MEAQVRELFGDLYLCQKSLTASEMDFINGCRKQFKKTKQLSEKQIRVLRDILKFLPTDATIRYTNIR